MSQQAGISRDTAHRIIREAGTMSWKQKREWAHAVLDAIPRDKRDIDQQLFRSHVETSLYSALGSQRDEVPPSLWKTVRVPVVVQSSRPFQPAFGLSMRPSTFLLKKPIG